MAELILRSGKRAGRRITLTAGDVVIGRDEDCRIRLTSSDVSRRHCMLRCAGADIVAADLGSRNGTYVNGSPISGPTPLKPGDLLRVGPFLFQVPGSSEGRSSDEAISGWLTEEGTIAGGPPANVGNDTTLVPDLGEASSDTTELKLAVVSRSVPPAAATEDAPPEPRPVPNDPIIGQAAGIIREYWSLKKTPR